MASRDIIYLDGLWDSDLLFPSYDENYNNGNNSILGHENNQERNAVGDDYQISSLGSNITISNNDENQMVQQFEAGLLGDVVVAAGHGSSQVEKNVVGGGRREILSSSLGLSNTMSNEKQWRPAVQQLETGLIWDGGMQVGDVQQEINNGGYEMSSLLIGPNTTCIENQMQQLNGVLGSSSIRGGVDDVGNNFMLPHEGRNEINEGRDVVPRETMGNEIMTGLENENEGRHVVSKGKESMTDLENEGQHLDPQKRKGKEVMADLENENEGRHVVSQKRKGKEIMANLENKNKGQKRKGKEIMTDLENEGRHVVPLKRKGKESITDVENVGKGKGKKKRKNSNRQPLDMETRVKIEQERRKKEAQLYADLRAMHPNLHPKAAKSVVIEETMRSIQSLKKTLESLEKKKLEMLLGLFNKNSNVKPLNINDQQPSSQKSLNYINAPRRFFTSSPSMNSSSSSNSRISAAVGGSTISTTTTTFKTWTSPNVTLNVCGTCAVISICCLKRHGLFTTICLILKNHNLDVVSAEIFSFDGNSIYMIHVRGCVPPELAEGFPHEELYTKAVAQIKFCIDL